MQQRFKKISDFLSAEAARAADASPPLRDAADQIFMPYILHRHIPEAAQDHFQTVLNSACMQINALDLHTFGMAVRALRMMGHERPQTVQSMEHEWPGERCLAYVHELDWEKPWGGSKHILHLMMPALERGLVSADDFFVQLEHYQNENGGWGNATFHRQMAAAFHFIPLYRLSQRPMPRLDRLAAGCLAQEPQGGGFGVMDALYILWYAVERGAIARQAVNVGDYWQKLESAAYRDRHDYIASAQTLSLLQALEADEWSMGDGWDPALWHW